MERRSTGKAAADDDAAELQKRFAELASLQRVILDQAGRIEQIQRERDHAVRQAGEASPNSDGAAISAVQQNAALKKQIAELGDALKEKERQRFSLELEIQENLAAQESRTGIVFLAPSAESQAELAELARIVREQEDVIAEQNATLAKLRTRVAAAEAKQRPEPSGLDPEMLLARLSPLLTGYRATLTQLICERDRALDKMPSSGTAAALVQQEIAR